VRQIRTLRAKWRELETGLRRLLGGHEGGNPGYRQGGSSGLPRQFSTLPEIHRWKPASIRLVCDFKCCSSPQAERLDVRFGRFGYREFHADRRPQRTSYKNRNSLS
jgi:hypothetical protein